MGKAPLLLVHGGAGRRSMEEDRKRYLDAVAAALDAGAGALAGGADAAVIAAVECMERDESLNAGRGSVLNADGRVSLDAGFMEGRERRYGAVACVARCTTPVVLAHRLHRDGDFGRFVAGPAADQLARRWAIAVCEPQELITERARERHLRKIAGEAGDDGGIGSDDGPIGDTVGAVALDSHGHLAAAVSTGGTAGKTAGRVGDTPVVGAGYWAVDGIGACVTTGVGEVLLREGTARRCVELLSDKRSAAEAAQAALAELRDHDADDRGQAGLIVVTATGDAAIMHTAAEMAAGWVREGQRGVASHQWKHGSQPV